MKYYGKSKRRNTRARKPLRSGTAKTTIKKAVRKARNRNFAGKVRAVIGRMAETKVANYAIQNKNIINVNSSAFQGTIVVLGSGSGGQYPMEISQGTGQANRIGNKITTQRLMIRGDVRLNTYFNNTTNYNPVPGYVTMWVVKLKPFLDDDVTTLKTVIDGSFFQAGNGAVGMTGQLQDLYRMPNAQQITVLKRRVWKIGTSSMPGGGASGSGDQSNQYWNNNDFRLSHLFKQDLTKCVPKILNFQDTNNNNVDRKSYLFFSFIRVDGAIPQTNLGAYSGAVPAYLDYEIDYTFKDL